ncbi:MAG: XdhC family protein [Anaerolineae bacterium]
MQSLERGEPVALATVVRAQGSTPREAGAKMLVRRDGSIVGTIGGGGLEVNVMVEAQEALQDGVSRLLSYTLRESQVEVCMTCGGDADVFVEVLGLDGQDVVEIFEAAGRTTAEGRQAALITVVRADRDRVGTIALLGPDGSKLAVAESTVFRVESVIGDALQALEEGEARLLGYQVVGAGAIVSTRPGQGDLDIFIDIIQPRATLIIAGGGHIAVPLAQLGVMLGFSVTVIDDRPNFATPERFPQVENLIVADFAQALRGVRLTPATCVVIITRGHKFDEVVLRQVIDSAAGYIGMIGSRRKVGMTLRNLQRDGIGEERVARIYAPIGLDLGAETPEEIALAIMAEILMTRRRASGQPMRDLWIKKLRRKAKVAVEE